MGFGAKAKEFQAGILMLRWKEKKIGGQEKHDEEEN